MASRIPDSEDSLRKLWDSFPRDSRGNVILQDRIPGEKISDHADPSIRALNKRFKAERSKDNIGHC